MEINKNKAKLIRNFFYLQFTVILYTLSGITAKFASHYGFLSFGFLKWYFLEFLILGVYALLWQQILKKFDLSIAYANKAISVIWSLIWAALIFDEVITFKNLIGGIIIIVGILVVNSSD